MHGLPFNRTIMVLRCATLGSPGAHSWDVGLILLSDCPVGPRSQLHERVQRDVHPRTLLLADVLEIRVEAPDDRLVRDDEDVLGPFELHDDRLQTNDNVTVGFTTLVAVVVFVFVPCSEVLGVFFFDFRILKMSQ
jgi:hypothetical protein